ncbi:MAG: hypothetical protein AAGG55_16680 [Pseudomonadota bacterium]
MSGESMILDIEFAVAYVHQQGVSVSAKEIEAAMLEHQLPALCRERGGEFHMFVHPRYFAAIRKGGGQQVELARSIWDLKAGIVEVKGPETRFEPLLSVSSDDLDVWVRQLKELGPEALKRGVQSLEHPSWELRPAKREGTYVSLLREYLQSSLDRREPVPNARSILLAWKKDRPHGIAVRDDLQGFSYDVNGSKVSKKYVSAKNLGKAIFRHVVVESDSEQGGTINSTR